MIVDLFSSTTDSIYIPAGFFGILKEAVLLLFDSIGVPMHSLLAKLRLSGRSFVYSEMLKVETHTMILDFASIREPLSSGEGENVPFMD